MRVIVDLVEFQKTITFVSFFRWLSMEVGFSSFSLVWLRYGQILFSDRGVAIVAMGE